MHLNEQAKGSDMDDATIWYKSKRLWVAVLTPVLPHIPVVGVILMANPELLMTALGLIFGGVSVATKRPIAFKK